MTDENVRKKFIEETEQIASISNLIQKVRNLFTDCSNNKYYTSDEKRVEKLLFYAFDMTIASENMSLIHYDDYLNNVKLLKRIYNKVESASRIIICFMSKNLTKEQVYKFLDENVNPTLNIINNNCEETCRTAELLFHRENPVFKYPPACL